MQFVTLNPIDSFVLKLYYRAATVINELFGISNFTVAHAWYRICIICYLAYIAATIAWLIAFSPGSNPGFKLFDVVAGGVWIFFVKRDDKHIEQLERILPRLLSNEDLSLDLYQRLYYLAKECILMLPMSVVWIILLVLLWGIYPGGTMIVAIMTSNLQMLYFARCIGLPGKKGRVQSFLEKVAFALNPRRLAPKPTLG